MWGLGNAINFIKKGENVMSKVYDVIVYQNSVKIHNSFLSL